MTLHVLREQTLFRILLNTIFTLVNVFLGKTAFNVVLGIQMFDQRFLLFEAFRARFTLEQFDDI